MKGSSWFSQITQKKVVKPTIIVRTPVASYTSPKVQVYERSVMLKLFLELFPPTALVLLAINGMILLGFIAFLVFLLNTGC